MDKNQPKVLAILIMRFRINPYDALAIASNWLKNHPNASWTTLKTLLLSGEVIFKNGVLHDITPTEIKILTNQMRGANGIKIKNRWYSFKLYPKCFTGNEAVDWFVKSQQVTREEAIQIGEMLISRQIIHHVHDAHDFKDEYLFYRFYIDEIQTAPSPSSSSSENIPSSVIRQDLI